MHIDSGQPFALDSHVDIMHATFATPTLFRTIRPMSIDNDDQSFGVDKQVPRQIALTWLSSIGAWCRLGATNLDVGRQLTKISAMSSDGSLEYKLSDVICEGDKRATSFCSHDNASLC
jgi:hypothetical protein